MKSFFVEWSCWPLSARCLAGCISHAKGRGEPFRNPGKSLTALPQWGARLALWLRRTALEVCTMCTLIGVGLGSYMGLIGPDSACFRYFPVLAGAGTQFESHLGHVFPLVRGVLLKTSLILRGSL